MAPPQGAAASTGLAADLTFICVPQLGQSGLPEGSQLGNPVAPHAGH